MIQRGSDTGTVRMNTKGEYFSREQYEESLPLFYTRQLLVSGTMPDSINGVEMDMHVINATKSTFRIRPRDIDIPQPGLYPMFESQSGRASLEMPKDYFRITWRMEFIDAASNKVLEEKSRLFSKAIYDEGFKFPAKSINGLPTTRKSCDEGYLIIDDAGQLFHVKMVKGEPYVVNVEIPKGLKFTYISCVDFRDKQFYAYLFSEDKHLYILTQDDYELVKLPLEVIDPTQYETQIFGDLFHYDIITRGDDFIKVDVIDSEFKYVDVYNEIWPPRDERKEGKIFNFLFTGQIKMAVNTSSFIRFNTYLNPTINWIFMSLLLIGLQFLIIRKRKIQLRNQVVDFSIIAVTGIFGFLAVNIFPNKFFD
jgi:hypothetical protein